MADPHSVEEHVTAVVSNMPTGRAWNATRIPGTRTRQLIEGLAETFFRMEAWVETLKTEYFPDVTEQMLPEWEQALELPCSCTTATATDAQRRLDILAKLSAIGVTTAADFVDFAERYGITLEVYGGARHGCFPMTFPIIFFPDAKTARFTIVVWYSVPPGGGFPYKFPFRFRSRELVMLECFFELMKPANCQLMFRRLTPYSVSGMCVDFEYADWQYMASGGPAHTADFNMVDQFSAMAWVKSEGSARDDHTIFMLGNPLVAHPRLELIHRVASGAMEMKLYNPGEGSKERVFGSTADDVWIQVGFTWDGTTDTLKLYVNGVEVPATSSPYDDTIEFTGWVVRGVIGARGNGAEVYDGKIHQVALWSSVLTAAEWLATYNAGAGNAFNLMATRAGYVSSGSCQHWYKVGNLEDPNIGADSGLTPVPISNLYSMDDTDRVADSPTG